MFKDIFATMNEALDGIMVDYKAAGEAHTEELEEQFHVLKAMSDSCLEEWLQFEERLSACRAKLTHPVINSMEAAVSSIGGGNPPISEHFAKGQGYYKLYMFDHAVMEFDKLVQEEPDFILGRVYLAMGYLRLGQLGEAYRHFQLILPLTSNTKLKAISYNALGCIQVHNQNMEQAYSLFKMADLTDSSFMEPALWSKEFWPYLRK